MFENAPEEIGSFISTQIGDTIRAGIAQRWPNESIDTITLVREGNSVYGLIAKTDPLTTAEMKAFVQGFFTAYNQRHTLA